MSKQLALRNDTEMTESEKIFELSDELNTIISNAKAVTVIEMIRAKYEMGAAIVTSPIYAKYAKSQGKFYESLAAGSGIKEDTLKDCAKFYEANPQENATQIAGKVFTEYGSWRKIRASLYGGDDPAEKEPCQKCKKCPVHCR